MDENRTSGSINGDGVQGDVSLDCFIAWNAHINPKS